MVVSSHISFLFERYPYSSKYPECTDPQRFWLVAPDSLFCYKAQTSISLTSLIADCIQFRDRLSLFDSSQNLRVLF